MIEVVLHEIVFTNNKSLRLSLIAEESAGGNVIKWAVSSEGRSNNPVIFFSDSILAQTEFKRRCGEAAITGLGIESNQIVAHITGRFQISEAKRSGFKVKRYSAKEADKWKRQVGGYTRESSPTLKLEE